MNGIVEKIGRRNIIIATLLVGIIAISIGYALIQTKTSLAVLTSPPPGIPGPYYVTAEAKIYGPVVDLAAIKSRMSGTFASDYTYVQWGTNPFYRVYADNTLQEVYYGQMVDVMNQLSWSFSIEENLKSTFGNLKNTGATDTSCVMGSIQYFGNMPGVYIAYYVGWEKPSSSTENIRFNVTTSSWLATEAHLSNYGSVKSISDSYEIWGSLGVYANDSSCIYLASKDGGNYIYNYDTKTTNSTGLSRTTTLRWHINVYAQAAYDKYGNYRTLTYHRAGVTVCVKDLLSFSTTAGSRLRIYVIIDSPGTGFVSKYLSPSSPVAGSPISVTVRLDPPSAQNINITDMYPNTFTWGSVDVLLEKFKVGVGFEESAYANVVPTPDGSNMKFTVYYNQAPSILQEPLSDEYIYLTYSLRVPDAAGEYTLPAASMSYLIPLP